MQVRISLEASPETYINYSDLESHCRDEPYQTINDKQSIGDKQSIAWQRLKNIVYVRVSIAY